MNYYIIVGNTVLVVEGWFWIKEGYDNENN